MSIHSTSCVSTLKDVREVFQAILIHQTQLNKTMTVQEILEYCEENGLNPETTEVCVYMNSAVGYVPANYIETESYGICLDYVNQ